MANTTCAHSVVDAAWESGADSWLPTQKSMGTSLLFPVYAPTVFSPKTRLDPIYGAFLLDRERDAMRVEEEKGTVIYKTQVEALIWGWSVWLLLFCGALYL